MMEESSDRPTLLLEMWRTLTETRLAVQSIIEDAERALNRCEQKAEQIREELGRLGLTKDV